MLLPTIFWVSSALILYTYVIYPLAIAVLAQRRRPAGGPGDLVPAPRSVSIVIAVHDEAGRITARLNELTRAISAAGVAGEVVVVTDGCRDNTVALVRAHPTPVSLVELNENYGKAYALTRGCAAARGEVLVFADARQRWAEDAVTRLLANFTQARIGAVSGELVLESTPGVLAGVGLYWRYEAWLRRNEGRVHSTVGVSGSIAAVRRELFRPIPPGILLDDVFWPLQVVMQGYRVRHDEQARAYDRLPERARDEFRRKVRTLSGNFQLLAALPQSLAPWRNPIWLQLISHKLLRLLVPWLLLVTLVSSALLPGTLYQGAFWAQVAFYALALLGLAGISRKGLAATAASFVTLNAAAWLGFWVWISGGSAGAWHKVHYRGVTGRE